MLSNDWIAPQQAFEHSDMFPDPDAAYLEAKKWHDSQEEKSVNAAMNDTTVTDVTQIEE